MLLIHDTFRELHFESTSGVADWLGSALRGIIARRFKEHSCRQPLSERETRWRYCKGCPLMDGCAYGETVEPDPPADRSHIGQGDGIRPLVIAPEYPAVASRPVRVRATFIGPRAAQHADAFWQATHEAGQTTGIGPAAARFAVQPGGDDRLSVVNVPTSIASDSTSIRRLRVRLVTPLCLEVEVERGGRKRTLLHPTLSDLFRASLRTVRSLHRLYGEPLPEGAFSDLKEAAESVATVLDGWQRMEHWQQSHRRGAGMEVWSIVGSAEFRDVPQEIARWLMWGGRVHVGTHRVKGYGGWVVETQDHQGRWLPLDPGA